MKTFKEIVEILKEKVDLIQWCYDDFDKEELEKELGSFERIEEHGGEGEGQNYYTIDYFKEHNVYVKLQASYYSYHGVETEGAYFVEVFPTEVTKIEFLTEKEAQKYNNK